MCKWPKLSLCHICCEVCVNEITLENDSLNFRIELLKTECDTFADGTMELKVDVGTHNREVGVAVQNVFF